jgi:hypothetical protein
MTPVTDDDSVEKAFEAFLAGRSGDPAAEGLTAFAQGVRACAMRPPRPSAALAELLATGLLTDQSSVPAPRAARTRRRRPRMIASALFAKIASAGLAAKAATVTGVVVVGFSTAGFTGALPASAQHAFATVVDHVTPLSAPDRETGTTEPTGEPAATTTAEPSEGDDGETGTANTSTVSTTPPSLPAQQTPDHPDNFGGTVSSLAHEGETAGGAASSLAHQRNDASRSGRAATASTTASSESATAPPASSQEVSSNGSSGDSHDSGRGSH